MQLLGGAALGIAMAATILIGQCIGANNLIEAKRVIGTSLIFFATISVAISVAGLVFAEPLLILMMTPPDSLPLAIAYMKMMALSVPSMYLYMFVVSVLNGAGNSKTMFYSTLLSVAIGVVLNPVFIDGLGSIPRLGIAGSGLAWFVAQAASLIALISYLYLRRYPLCLRTYELCLCRPNWSIVCALTRKGIPTGAIVFVLSLSGVLMFVLVNRFGIDTTAAFGASLQLWTYVQMPALAIGVAVTAMVAQNVGAGEWDRVMAVAVTGVVFSVLMTGAVVFLIYALDIYAYRIFLPAGSPALPIASHINSVVIWSFLPLSICIVLFGAMRATGSVIVPLLINSISLLVVRFSVAAALLEVWHSDAIWWSFPISSVLALVLATLSYTYGGRNRLRPMISAPLK